MEDYRELRRRLDEHDANERRENEQREAKAEAERATSRRRKLATHVRKAGLPPVLVRMLEPYLRSRANGSVFVEDEDGGEVTIEQAVADAVKAIRANPNVLPSDAKPEELRPPAKTTKPAGQMNRDELNMATDDWLRSRWQIPPTAQSAPAEKAVSEMNASELDAATDAYLRNLHSQ